MTKTKQLIELVKSLSPAEKRFFKQFLKINPINSSNYEQMFISISKMKSYTEPKWRRLFKKDDSKQNIKYKENHLYDLILDSLAHFNKRNQTINILSKLQQIEVLINKKLLEQAMVVIKSTKEEANFNFQYFIILKLLDFEKMLWSILPEKDEDQIIRLENDYQETINKIINEKEFEQLIHTGNKLIKEIEFARTDEQLESYNKLLSHRLYKDIDKIKCNKSKFYFYSQIPLLFFSHNIEKSTITSRNQLTFYKANKKQFKHPVVLFSSYTRHLNDLIFSNHNEAENFLQEYQLIGEELKKKSKVKYLHWYVVNFELSLVYHLRNGNKEILSNIVSEFDFTQLQEFSKIYPTNYTYALYTLSQYYLSVKDFHQTINYIDLLLEDKEKSRKGLLSAAYILKIIALYELGERDYLESIINSSEYFIKKNNVLFATEKTMLSFFRKIINTTNKNEVIQKYHNKLVKLKSTKFESVIFNYYFDYEQWLKEKL